MVSAGLVPFSGSMLTGEIGSATIVLIADGDANVASTAHGYMPHNAYRSILSDSDVVVSCGGLCHMLGIALRQTEPNRLRASSADHP